VEYIDLRTGNLWADGAYLKPKLMMAFDIKVSSRQIAKSECIKPGSSSRPLLLMHAFAHSSLSLALLGAQLDNCWFMIADDGEDGSGKPYYYNPGTLDMQWLRPWGTVPCDRCGVNFCERWEVKPPKKVEGKMGAGGKPGEQAASCGGARKQRAWGRGAARKAAVRLSPPPWSNASVSLPPPPPCYSGL